MKCPRCQHENTEGQKFCGECGTRLTSVCGACGSANPEGQRFCGDCGAPLSAGTPIAKFATPESYTPKHLAEKILTSRSTLEGERKQVTVLFVDVSGFTSISEGLDPEDVHRLMTRAFELMLAEVHRYEGTVNQFLGDGLMALFGAPIAHEDHARRAALATLGIQSALTAYHDELLRTRGIEFRVRMGLNTGLVVVGAIGDNLRMDYTAVGDTTNVAARIQQLSQPGEILVGDQTRRLIEPWFELASRGSVTVKNRAEPVGVWHLDGRRRTAPVRQLSPFVGRADALATLTREAASARAGPGRAVYIVGEPGMGKSRLLVELHRQLGDSMTWIEGHCVSFGQSTPFLPVMEALRGLFGILDSDTEIQAIERIELELAGLGEAARGIGPYVRFALSLDCGDAALPTMEPKERLSRLLQATTRLFRLKSQTKRIVIVIEDLHWIDAGSENYLKTVVDDLGGLPVLLILSWRPSYRAPFSEHTYVSRLVLEPLADGDALTVVRAILGIGDLPDELARSIARKAEGNPFFLEELGHALLETGAVRTEGSRLVLARPASAIIVPDRVQDVIAARIDRLREDQKRAVQTASVIGREFALRLLRRVVDVADRLEQALGELKTLEFVYEKAALDDLEYVFRHALTQDVAYESILHARRRELHARIGSAIEELYADRLDERVEELAYHFRRGEAWEKTARYARQAGERAASLCLDDKAEEFYGQALEALSHLPETAVTARLGIELRLDMRAPLWRRGQLDRLSALLKEVEVLATRHGETDRLDAVYAFFTQYHWAKGEQQQAIRYGERCLEAAARRDDLGLRVTGHYYLGWAHFVLGNFQQCLAHERTILDLLEGPRATERFGLSGLPYCGACAQAAWCLVETGDVPGAFEFLDRGDRVAEAARHLYSTVPLTAVRGRALLAQGRVAEAQATLERVVATCREKKFAGQLMLALDSISKVYSLAGRHEEAISAASEAVRVKDEARAPVNRGLHLAAVSEAYSSAARLDEAEVAAHEALDWARQLGERPSEALAQRLLGEIAGRRGDHAAATRHLREGLAIATELGMNPLAERCRVALAGLS